MSNPKHVALYGGAFDPPHLGHAHVIKAILASKYVSEVKIIPASDSRYDKKPFASFGKRLDMLNLFVADLFPNEERIKVLDIQGNVPVLQKSYAIDTVEYLKNLIPEGKLAWVIGEDNVSGLANWRRAKDLFKLITFLVIRRPDVDDSDGMFPHMAKLEYIQVDSMSYISSSEIRTKIKSNHPIFSLVSQNVLRYIASSRLYLEK